MKDGTKLKVAADVVGLVAVIATLVFVGMEIRQNTRAVRSATTQAISDQAMELTLSMATDEHLPRLVSDMVLNGITQRDLEPEDNMRLHLAVYAGLRRQENLYLQVQNDILPESALRNVSFPFYQNAYARELWESNRDRFDAGFASYWDGILREQR